MFRMSDQEVCWQKSLPLDWEDEALILTGFNSLAC